MELIKSLRETSGAPIVDCKKALQENDNDVSLALDWLRQHGAAKVSSKVADRVATEGLVGFSISEDSTKAALVHVASETDFAGRSETFVDLVLTCADAALQTNNNNTNGTVAIDELLTVPVGTDATKTVQDAVADAMVAIRENLSVTQATNFSAAANGGVVVGYVHGKVLPSSPAGTAAAMVELAPLKNATTVDKDFLLDVGKKLAMHIVAAQPQYLDAASVPTDVVEAERVMLTNQIELDNANQNKPPEIIAKIVEGRLRKFYETTCLLEQQHMIEPENPKIGKHLASLGIQCHRFSLVSVA